MYKVISLILIIFFVSCGKRRTDETEEFTSKLERIRQDNRFVKFQNKLIKEGLQFSIRHNDTVIPKDLSFLSISSDTVTISDYVSDSKALVFYAGAFFCSSCVSEELALLNDYAAKSETLKVVVLAKNISVRELLIEQTKGDFDFEMGVIVNDFPSNHEFSIQENPIYFVADTNLKLSKVFLPNKGLKEMSERYLATILK